MAKAKRRASKKQLAALAKARTALKAKYGTADISKIAKKKGKKRRAAKAAAAPALSMADMLSGGPKKRRTKKRRTKKRTKKAATRRAAPKKRRTRRTKKTAARRAAPKRRRRRSAKRARHTVGGKVHIVKMPTAARVKVIRIEEAKRRRRRKKRALLENPSMGYELAQLEENPLSYSALFENPTGPYSMSSLKSFGWAAGGVGVGLVLAELADRYIATRAPADSKDGAKGAHPWYGRDAVAAIQRRPDAMRLGVQAAGALAGIGGAYLAGKRGGRILPWALGGAAVGFGANLAKQLLVWWVLPAVLKVPLDANGQPDYSKPGLANRLVPLEQKALQDTIDGLWEKWNLVADLKAGQDPTPLIQSPLGDQTNNLLTLGGATGNGPLPVAGRPYWVGQPGAVGSCMSCGGMQGHWSNCPSNCPDCPGGSGIPGGGDGGSRDGGGYPQLCEYTVQRGDSLEALLAATGLSMNEVANLNGGGLPTTWWTPGNTVTLPVAMCMEITRRRQPTEPRFPPPSRPTIPREPPVFRGPPGETFTRANLPRDPGETFTRANLPGTYVPPVVAGAEDPIAHRAALRGVGGEDTNDSND